MKRTIQMILLTAVLTLGGVSAAILATPAQDTCGSRSCGIKPIKPIPPMGCKDLIAVCVCDSRGCNCHWEWQCVPN